MGMTKEDFIGSDDAAEFHGRADRSNLSMYRVLIRWFTGHNPCAAARVMAAVMSGVGYESHGMEVPCPKNIPELKDCLDLIDLFPKWDREIKKMSKVSVQWMLLANSWPELESLFRAGKNADCFNKLNETAAGISPSIRKI